MLFKATAWAGLVIVCLILGFSMAALAALGIEGWGAFNWRDMLDPYLWYITGFSIKQALLSAFISVLLAIPVAKLIACRQFKAKQLLLTVCNLCFVLPTIVVVLGIVSVYGRSGWLNHWLNTEYSIYGLTGILLCHVFLNFPFATRVFVNVIEQIPVNQWRLAEQLGFKPIHRFYWLEWQVIKSQLFPLFGLLFLLCFNSFTVVLAMGGGPQSTTLEVAIYQALRYDYEPGFAVLLASLQLVMTAPIALLLFYYQPALTQASKGIYRKIQGLTDKWLLLPIILIFGLWLLLPLLALLIGSLNFKVWADIFSLSLINASIKSFTIAAASSILTVISALVIVSLLYNISKFKKHKEILGSGWSIIIEGISASTLYFPAIVLATGWFILLWQISDVFQYTLLIVIIINTLMTMPFAIRTLKVPFFQVASHYHSLALHLGVTGWPWWRLVAWPVLSTAIGQAAALAFVLSLGDMGIVVLIGDTDFITLPLLVYRYLANYQYPQAAALSVLLLICCFISFYLIEKLFRRQHA